MKFITLLPAGSLLLIWSFTSIKNSQKALTSQTSVKIMFGSCANQDKPLPMLSVAKNENPDVFIFLGDNIYGDTFIMDTLESKYKRLEARKEFRDLRESTTVYATWDDHDYGWNDAGRHYPFKQQSKEIFMDFWQVPAASERRKHDGIYGTEYLKKNGKIIQIILLDTRSFRDDLVHRNKFEDKVYKNDYTPNSSPDSTFLGPKQWNWLEEELKKPADFRLIASSNQFAHEYNGWESWTNVPHERQRFVELIKQTKANRVVFISGDVHWGEISKLAVKNGYPIYDITSSGITQTWHKIESNKNRIGKAFPQNNVGMITIDWSGQNGVARFSLIDSSTKAVTEHSISLSEIAFD